MKTTSTTISARAPGSRQAWPAAMGAVAGTAAGHAWREPGARALIVVLVVFIMLVAAVELPLAAATADGQSLLGPFLK